MSYNSRASNAKTAQFPWLTVSLALLIVVGGPAALAVTWLIVNKGPLL